MRPDWTTMIASDHVEARASRELFEANFDHWYPRVAGWIGARVPDEGARQRLVRDVFVRAMPLLASPISDERLGPCLLELAREAVSDGPVAASAQRRH